MNLDVFGAEQSTRDLGFINRYVVTVNEQDFEIMFGSNFLISSHTFSASDRML